MATITMKDAVRAYHQNDQVRGYAPYADVPGEDTVDNAIAAAQADGWDLVLPRHTSGEIAVLRNADGELLGIGGDAQGKGARAVPLDLDV